MTDIHELFCLNLKSKRIAKGITQETLADKLGVGLRHVQKIEYGYKDGSNWPSPDRLRSLAKIFKCDTVDFFKPIKKA